MTAADETRRDPFRWLLDVGAALVGSASAHDALQQMAAAIGRAMNVAQVDIQSLDRERDVLRQEATWDREGLSEKDLAFLGTEIPLKESPGFMRIIAHREMDETHIDDPDLTDAERAAFVEWGYKATLDAPLVVGDEVVGVLGVTESRYLRRFMAAERERFEQLAALTAAAIRNMRIAASERVHGARLAVLLELTGLLADGDAAGAARAAADGCLRQLGAARAAVYELQADGSPTVRAEKPEPGGVVAADAWPALLEQRRGADRLLVVRAASCEPGDPLAAVLDEAHEAAWLAVPLAFLDQTLGWFVVAWSDGSPSLDDDQLAFAVAVGEQLATGLENDRLIAEMGLDVTGASMTAPADCEELLESEKEV